MMHITEDTPPDMLLGAMDLTVHLPSGRSIKMCVERSTPMMDLLVQITTTQHIQLSNYILQALYMAPSSEYSDKILPYKPNTPIGALDTQHIKVVPKSRTLPVPKNVPPGHQPFESTFRLKVHLPRNQLYVTRVSRNVMLEDIMRKVCEEKLLDPMKYEFRHPGNLDQTLDPKRTLHDYQITEIYVIHKGSNSLNQAFSSNDIMALRKEEERKQMHNKTGGGVINLIFRRAKSSTGSGSISNDNSDDSRSVTPPTVQPHFITPKQESQCEKPRVPQRKRRPAPKPPQQIDQEKITERRISDLSESVPNEIQTKFDQGLTICHSRNSSDSSGYHETSVLSDNCNTSLPRKNKSSTLENSELEHTSKHSVSTSNLMNMSLQSKSTSSLGYAGRKKKAAPPPPPLLKSSTSVMNLKPSSPVGASQTSYVGSELSYDTTGNCLKTTRTNPLPTPRRRKAPTPRPRTSLVAGTVKDSRNSTSSSIMEEGDCYEDEHSSYFNSSRTSLASYYNDNDSKVIREYNRDEKQQRETNSPSYFGRFSVDTCSSEISKTDTRVSTSSLSTIDISNALQYQNEAAIPQNDMKPPEIIGIIPKEGDVDSIIEYDSISSQNTKSSTDHNENTKTFVSATEVAKDPKAVPVKMKDPIIGEMNDINEEIFSKTESSARSEKLVRQSSALDILKDKNLKKNLSVSSLRSVDSISSLEEPMKRWNDKEDLDEISLNSVGMKNNWVVSEESDADSQSSFSYKKPIDLIKPQAETIDIDSITSTNPAVRTNADVIGHQHESTNHLRKSEEVPNENMKTSSENSSEADQLTISTASNISTTSASELTTVDSLGTTTKQIDDKTSFSDDAGSVPSKSTDDIARKINEQIENKTLSRRYSNEPITISPEATTKQIVRNTMSPINDTDVKTVLDKKLNSSTTTSFNHFLEENIEPDWQYQLPSPPKAFRDSSPANRTKLLQYDRATETDSVVTSPELFEKLKSLQDRQLEEQSVSDKTSIVSEDKTSLVSDDKTSIVSEDKPILNKLSLENLEKRKSLVYNREISTSLKMSEPVEANKKPNTFLRKNISDQDKDGFSSSLMKFEETLESMSQSSQTSSTNAKNRVQVQRNSSTNTGLSNFKITTYDNPKQKFDIYEDDTIRSNAENSYKRNAVNRADSMYINGKTTNLQRSAIGRSMESISADKFDLENDDVFKKPKVAESRYYRPKMEHFKSRIGRINRSESFSSEQNGWSPSKPVARSKSQVALNRYNEDVLQKYQQSDQLVKSNSLFDVSGLQSLEVMKLIQNKLNTPTTSTEELDRVDQKEVPVEAKATSVPPQVKDTPTTPPATKIYHYSGPPSINMSTWSERPKIPVSVKEDADYKLGVGTNNKHMNSRISVNTYSNQMKSNNSIETKSIGVNNFNFTNGLSSNVNNNQTNSQNVSIKVNGSEPITTQKNGNVLIKIGDSNQNNNNSVGSSAIFSQSNNFQNRTTQRPHSVAFPSDFDISHVPIVRSVELKRPLRDIQNNTSITPINQSTKTHFSDKERTSLNNFSIDNKFLNTETSVNKKDLFGRNQHNTSNPISRTKSFLQPVPTVKGFRSMDYRDSSQPNAYSTAPTKVVEDKPIKQENYDLNTNKQENYETNKNVPFSQFNLRKIEPVRRNNRNLPGDISRPKTMVESNNIMNDNLNKTSIILATDPPPPPKIPNSFNGEKNAPKKFEPVRDLRDDLLQSIREFGGKKGLRSKKC